MIRIHLACHTAAIIILGLATICPTLAEAQNRAAPRAENRQRLRFEVEELRRQIADRRVEMVNRAWLSANGQLDPGSQLLAQEVAALEARLAQRTADLVRQDADIQQDDLKAVLQSITAQLADVTARLSRLETAQQAATGTWRTLEVEGVQYYLVPVEKIDPQKSSAKRSPRGPKVIQSNKYAPAKQP